MHSHRLNVSPKILYAIAISTVVVLFSLLQQQSKKMENTSAHTRTHDEHKSIEKAKKDAKNAAKQREKIHAQSLSRTHARSVKA